MIIPHKYLNLELSIINISSEIIRILKDDNIEQYDEILRKLKENHGNSVADMYNLSLTFLYAFDKIKYHKEIDSIEFLS